MPPAAEGTRAAIPGADGRDPRALRNRGAPSGGQRWGETRGRAESPAGSASLGAAPTASPPPGGTSLSPLPPQPPPPGGGTLRVAATSTGPPCPAVTERVGPCRTGRALRSRTGALPAVLSGTGAVRGAPGPGHPKPPPAMEARAAGPGGDGYNEDLLHKVWLEMGMVMEAPGRGLQRGGEGAGLLLELPNKCCPSACLAPRLPVGSVCHPRAGAGGAGCGDSSVPAVGTGSPQGLAPVLATSRLMVGRGVAGFGMFGKPGLLE